MSEALEALHRLARALGTIPAMRHTHGSMVMAVLDEVLQTLVGHKLLTVLKIDAAQQWSTRWYSSQPERFAAQRRKALCDAPQMRRVIAAGVPLLVNGVEQVRAAFPDHQRIFDLGCASVLNIPVRIAHRSVANINLLHEADHYPAPDSEAVKWAEIACQMVGGVIALGMPDPP